jgi:hypothetical protein
MSLSLQPIRVATGFDEEGMMVLDQEQRLVAVLVRLSDENEVAPGQWFLEAGFGQIDGTNCSSRYLIGHSASESDRVEPVGQDQAAIIFSFASGMPSTKVCIGVLPKHHRPWCGRSSL